MMTVRRTILAALVAVLAIGGFVLTGCSGNSPKLTVEETSGTSAMTARERGELRTKLVRLAREGIAAWRLGDVKGMKKTFAPDLASFYAKQKAKYAKQGRVRVRDHQLKFLDLVEFNDPVTEASIQYRFVDRSYFKDIKTGRILSRDKSKATEIDLTVDKKSGEWRIVRMFGADAVLK